MAAFAALRRAWIAAGGLHPQVHGTPTPLRWCQVKTRLASPQHSQDRAVVLFRPAIRHQSTAAAAAGAQVAQAAATAPVETVVPLEELSHVAGDSTLAELGLGGFSPVGLIMKILESLHLGVGLPWWGAIVGGVFLNVQLSQSLFKTQEPGQSVKLICAASGVEVGGWFWGWNRKCPGKSLEWLGGISSTNNGGEAYYNSCFNNQIVITRDTSKNEFYLELRSLAPADIGLYFCARHRAP